MASRPQEHELDPRALQALATQLDEATRATKCHGCGCFQETVAALEATEAGATHLSRELAAARRAFAAKAYDCLGCSVCYPALAANAFTEAFPSASEMLDLCPTAPPVERSEWPPLPGAYTVVRVDAPVAVCTLNSEALANELASDPPDALAIVGTLHTENLGIERVIQNVLANANVRVLVICGEDTTQAIGHLPGQSLASLLEGGVDERGRIRGAKGKRPILKNVTGDQIEAFRRQVEPVVMLGETSAQIIRAEIRKHGGEAHAPLARAPADVAVPVVRAEEPRGLVLDPAGYFVVYPDPTRRVLRVEHFTNTGVLDAVIEGVSPAAVCATAIEEELVSRLDHAAYLGQELARAARAIDSGEPYVQDRAPGEPPSCGCAGSCGRPR